MLPQINFGQGTRRRTRPRPINPLDNPSTTGLLVNPNGSYIANPTGAGGYGGPQGGFGYGLPSSGLSSIQNTGTPISLPPTFFQPSTQPTPTFGYGTARPGLPGYKPPPAIVRGGAQAGSGLLSSPISYSAQAAMPPQLQGQYSPALSPQNALTAYRQGEQGNVFDPANPIFNAVVQRLARGEAADLTPQDQEALERVLATGQPVTPGQQPSGGGGGGNNDFMNTRFMQQNQEQGIGFYDQLRWDPERKKYVKIGDLIRQGRLDVRTGKTINRRRRRGGGGGGRSPVQPNEQPRFGYGVIQNSLNTATG